MDTYEFHLFNENNRERQGKRVLFLIQIVVGLMFFIISAYFILIKFDWSTNKDLSARATHNPPKTDNTPPFPPQFKR